MYFSFFVCKESASLPVGITLRRKFTADDKQVAWQIAVGSVVSTFQKKSLLA